MSIYLWHILREIHKSRYVFNNFFDLIDTRHPIPLNASSEVFCLAYGSSVDRAYFPFVA